MTPALTSLLALAPLKNLGGRVTHAAHNGAGRAAALVFASLTLTACSAGVDVADFVSGTGTAAGSSGGECAPSGAVSGSQVWSHRYGDQSWGSVTSAAVDPAGNVVLAGWFEESLDLGCGAMENNGNFDSPYFVAELDAEGTCLWSHGFPNQLGPTVVAVGASGTVFLAGSFEAWGDFGGGTVRCDTSDNCGFVAAFDGKGAYLWADLFDEGGGEGLAIDAAGNVVLVGVVTGSTALGGGQLTGSAEGSFFVAKLDAGGALQWSKALPDPWAKSVAVDAAGSIFVTGAFEGAFDFGGGMISGGAGDPNAYVVKLDAGGAYQWAKVFASPSEGWVEGVATDPAGAVVVTGAMRGPTDFGAGPIGTTGAQSIFLAKLDPGGAPVWSEAFRNDGTFTSDPMSNTMASAVAVDASGNVLVHGWFGGSIDLGGGTVQSGGDFGFFLASFDSAGKARWGRAFGATGSDLTAAIGLDPCGDPVVAGAVVGTVNFGGGPLASPGGTTAAGAYVAKLVR